MSFITVSSGSCAGSRPLQPFDRLETSGKILFLASVSGSSSSPGSNGESPTASPSSEGDGPSAKKERAVAQQSSTPRMRSRRLNLARFGSGPVLLGLDDVRDRVFIRCSPPLLLMLAQSATSVF